MSDFKEFLTDLPGAVGVAGAVWVVVVVVAFLATAGVFTAVIFGLGTLFTMVARYYHGYADGLAWSREKVGPSD